MLFKTTLKLLLVNTKTKSLLLPIVSNSYKKTLWLLRHREDNVEAIGIIEGPYDELNGLKIGDVDVSKLHQVVMRTTNALYTSIGKQPQLPEVFDLDYSLPIEAFILKYTKLFTPDELMVILGTKHSKIFKIIGNLVKEGKITYIPDNGPGKWSYYDYFWLHERYKHPKLLDIKHIINRSRHQIKTRALNIGITRKVSKRIVNNIPITLIENATTTKCLCGKPSTIGDQCKACASVHLTDVERDYMISQISSVVSNIISQKDTLEYTC